MEEIEKKIEVVLEMLQSDIAWVYQRLTSHTAEKSFNSFVSRADALKNSKELIANKLETL